MNSGLTSSAPGAAPARRRRLAELPAGRNLEVRPASSMELPDLADLLLDKYRVLSRRFPHSRAFIPTPKVSIP